MTDNERELSEQLFGGQQQSMGALEAIKEGFKEFRDAMAPGLTWDKFTSDLTQELTHQAAAGAHELAAALFNGNAFVMYQRDGKEDEPIQDRTQEAEHLERGGRSM